MSNEFQDFVRKQFPVQAARVTPMNIEELAEACGGKIMHDGEKENNFSRDYIKVRVAFPLNEEQTKARIGDWLVKQGRTFKVYKDKPFRSTFENRDGTPVPGGNQKNRGKGKPSPANMPKKKPEGPREEQEAFAAEQAEKEAALISQKIDEGKLPLKSPAERAHEAENKVAEAVEQTPPPAEEKVEWDIDANRPMEETRRLENAKIVSANLVEGPPDPSKGVHPIEVVEPQPEELGDAFSEVDAAYPEPEQKGPQSQEESDAMSEPVEPVEEEKKPITLDELNTHPGDPRTADDIHREGQQQG